MRPRSVLSRHAHKHTKHSSPCRVSSLSISEVSRRSISPFKHAHSMNESLEETQVSSHLHSLYDHLRLTSSPEVSPQKMTRSDFKTTSKNWKQVHLKLVRRKSAKEELESLQALELNSIENSRLIQRPVEVEKEAERKRFGFFPDEITIIMNQKTEELRKEEIEWSECEIEEKKEFKRDQNFYKKLNEYYQDRHEPSIKKWIKKGVENPLLTRKKYRRLHPQELTFSPTFHRESIRLSNNKKEYLFKTLDVQYFGKYIEEMKHLFNSKSIEFFKKWKIEYSKKGVSDFIKTNKLQSYKFANYEHLVSNQDLELLLNEPCPTEEPLDYKNIRLVKIFRKFYEVRELGPCKVCPYRENCEMAFISKGARATISDYLRLINIYIQQPSDDPFTLTSYISLLDSTSQILDAILEKEDSGYRILKEVDFLTQPIQYVKKEIRKPKLKNKPKIKFEEIDFKTNEKRNEKKENISKSKAIDDLINQAYQYSLSKKNRN